MLIETGTSKRGRWIVLSLRAVSSTEQEAEHEAKNMRRKAAVE
jgi:hypothetical protein